MKKAKMSMTLNLKKSTEAWLKILVQNMSMILQKTSPGIFIYHQFSLLLHSRVIEEKTLPVAEIYFGREGLVPSFEQRIHDVALEMGLVPIGASLRGEKDSLIFGGETLPVDKAAEKDVLYLGDDTALILEVGDTKSSFSGVTRNRENLSKFQALAEEFKEKPAEDKGCVHLLVSSPHGLGAHQAEVSFDPLIRANYSESVLSDFDRVISILRDEKPSGRLVILDGPQGTGKSYMIRGIINVIPLKEASFLIVPSEMVVSLAGPSLLSFLLNFKGDTKIILIIEDADAALVQRDGTNENMVSTLLNLTDGILGEVLDLRVICTTNRKLEDIDKAIKRKGRLACHMHLGNLSVELARKVYLRLAGGGA
ncbi:MAG: AAA family ATPase, partial [Bacteroidota bacterium]